MKILLQQHATALCSCLRSIIDCLPIEGAHTQRKCLFSYWLTVLVVVGDPSRVELKEIQTFDRRDGFAGNVFVGLRVDVSSQYSNFLICKLYF